MTRLRLPSRLHTAQACLSLLLLATACSSNSEVESVKSSDLASTTATSVAASPEPTATAIPTPVPTLFAGTAQYSDESGYTFAIDYALTNIGTAVSDPTNSKPGQTQVSEPVSATLTITNTTSGRSAPLTGNLTDLTIAALYKPTRAVCNQTNYAGQLSPKQIETHDAVNNAPVHYCSVDLFQGATSYTTTSLEPSQTFTYQVEAAGHLGPVDSAEIFQMLDTTGLPAVQTDLATPPDAYMVYTGPWNGANSNLPPSTPQCGQYGGLGGTNISVIAASVPTVCG